jgi:hypothetical protein
VKYSAPFDSVRSAVSVGMSAILAYPSVSSFDSIAVISTSTNGTPPDAAVVKYVAF